MRPTHKELSNKLASAKSAVQRQYVFLINQDAIAEDALELGYSIALDLYEVLTELLGEVSLTHYAGSNPPQKSYMDEIQGVDLFPFVIESHRFRCRVYFKFAVTDGWFWLVSLHRDRPLKESQWKK